MEPECEKLIYEEQDFFDMGYRTFSGGTLQPWHGGKVTLRKPSRKQTEPLIGWRAWRLNGTNLQSLIVNHIWEGPVFRAEGPPDVLKPSPQVRKDVVHGIYSFRDFKDALQYLRFQNTTGAIGRLELTGRVVVHEKGYRAEVATITDLFVPVIHDSCFESIVIGDAKGFVNELEQVYHCTIWTDFDAFLTQIVEREEKDGDR